jgi:hypothetical protein
MQSISPLVERSQVTVDYDHSGLGFAGDPNGPDVAPIVTVQIANVVFRSPLLFGARIPLPAFRATLTLEDGRGTRSN